MTDRQDAMPEPRPSASLSLLVRRVVKGNAERVFGAWTRADQIMKWWGPAHISCPQCDVDLRVGGRYRIANLLPDGSTIWIIGQFLRIDQPHLLEYSWQSGADPQFDPDTASKVTVRFLPKGPNTEIVVEHTSIPDEQTRTNHNSGWLGCLDELDAFIDTMGSP
ncbi:MAG: SRPBCC domain-containing protein [Hyphomicrobiales bacterium]